MMSPEAEGSVDLDAAEAREPVRPVGTLAVPPAQRPHSRVRGAPATLPTWVGHRVTRRA
jgi:hypothetical protein